MDWRRRLNKIAADMADSDEEDDQVAMDLVADMLSEVATVTRRGGSELCP